MSSNYDREELIGSGTFGNVFLVRCRATGDLFVLKEVRISSMSAAERQQALTEVTVLKKCLHKNIIRYKEATIESDKGLLCIVMEYAECGDMYAAIKRQQGVYFNEADVVSWFIQITLALRYIHHLNILHRDLKTQNIFLTENKLIKIGDFGIARVLKGDKELATTAIGTPFYLSPEICLRKPYNCKSDIWALGCILFEMAALVHPFQGQNFHQLMFSILKVQRRELPSHTGPLIEDLVNILLVADPEERPSADEILSISALQPYIHKYIDEFASPETYAELRDAGSLKKHDSSRRLSADDVLSGIRSPNAFSKRHPSVSEAHKGALKTKKTGFSRFPVIGKVRFGSSQQYKVGKANVHSTSDLISPEDKIQKRRAPGPHIMPSPPTKKSDILNREATPKGAISRTYTLLRKAMGKGNVSRVKNSSFRRSSVPDIESEYNITYRAVRSNSDACAGTNVASLQSVDECSCHEESPTGRHSDKSDDVFIAADTTTSHCSQKKVCDYTEVDSSNCNAEHCCHCPHVSHCFQCLLDVLWKSRILKRNNNENDRIKLKNKLLGVFGKEKFNKVYQTMLAAWEKTAVNNNALQIVLKMLGYDHRQFVPLFIQLIQLDMVNVPSPVSSTSCNSRSVLI